MHPDHSASSQDVLESVAGLTEQRDQAALERCLMTTLCELAPVTNVALYRLSGDGPQMQLALSHPPGAHDARGDAATLQNENLHDAARLFSRYLQKQDESPASATDTISIFYPVFGPGDRLQGMLAVTYPHLSQPDHRLVGALLRIHQNYQVLLHESQRDRLTGLFNRRTLDEYLTRALSASHQHERVSDAGKHFLCILDIDHFKRVNDSFGHLYGDEVLLVFSQIMRKTFRSEDQLFRYGGEEFVVVLRTRDAAECLGILERFRNNVAGQTFPQVGQITVSIGAVTMQSGALPSTTIEHADQALYYAKNHGRNQIHLYEDLIAQGQLKDSIQSGSVDLF